MKVVPTTVIDQSPQTTPYNQTQTPHNKTATTTNPATALLDDPFSDYSAVTLEAVLCSWLPRPATVAVESASAYINGMYENITAGQLDGRTARDQLATLLCKAWDLEEDLTTKYGFIATVLYTLQVALPVYQNRVVKTVAPLQLLADVICSRDLLTVAYDSWDATAGTVHAHKHTMRPPDLPAKAHPGAVGKVNVCYALVRSAIARIDSSLYSALRHYERHPAFRLLYNDQAAGVALYAFALKGMFRQPVKLALTLVLYPALAKDLTNVLKSLGANGVLHGALLCEADTIRGRAVGNVSLVDEARCRSNPSLLNVYEPDRQELLDAIRAILAEELPECYRATEWEDVDHFWARRSAHTANGAHHDSRFQVDRRIASHNTRRSAMEQVERNLITSWDARCEYSASLKLEHGKSRALFSADTSSYYAFSHLLTTVERKWVGRRVLLDPGLGGTYGMVRRVKAAGPGVYLMIDYTDFNAQHSLWAQQAVIRSVGETLAYPGELLDKLVASFDNGTITVPLSRAEHNVRTGRHYKIAGTLMSGHRATSFINSVLNRAYLLTVDKHFADVFALHVGDDVCCVCRTRHQAALLIAATMLSGVRINPVKQSVGEVTFEFLRTATSGDTTYMYVARSISSFVSGNWTSLNILNPMEALTTMARAAWTFENRTGCSGKGRIFGPFIAHCCKMISDTEAAGIAAGTVSVNAGPVRYAGPVVKCIDIVADNSHETAQLRRKLARLNANARCATNAYLRDCVTKYDAAAMAVAERTPLTPMLRASYAKALASSGDTSAGRVVVKRRTFALRVTKPQLLDVVKIAKTYNPINPSFVACLLLPGMTKRQVDKFIQLTGLDYDHVAEIRKDSCSAPAVTMSPIVYSDAASFTTHASLMVPLLGRHRYLA